MCSRGRCPTTLGSPLLFAAAITVVLGLIAPDPLRADIRSQGGVTFVGTDVPTKPKKLDELHSALEIPNDLDRNGAVTLFCQIFVGRRSADGPSDLAGVKGVRVAWQVMAYLVDGDRGSFQTFGVGSGTARTDTRGDALLFVDLPTGVGDAIFTDAFESGETSAFLVARGRPRAGKKTNNASFSCRLEELGR